MISVYWCLKNCITVFICIFLTAMKIHISCSTKNILEQFDAFKIELRGEVEMKVGKHNLLCLTKVQLSECLLLNFTFSHDKKVNFRKI